MLLFRQGKRCGKCGIGRVAVGAVSKWDVPNSICERRAKRAAEGVVLAGVTKEESTVLSLLVHSHLHEAVGCGHNEVLDVVNLNDKETELHSLHGGHHGGTKGVP